MPDMLRIILPGRIAVVRSAPVPGTAPDDDQLRAQLEQERRELDRLRHEAQRRLEAQLGELRDAQEVLVAAQEALHAARRQLLDEATPQLAALAVRLAGKVLCRAIEAGDYDVEAIVAGALSRLPHRREAIVRLSVRDLDRCREGGHVESLQAVGVRLVGDPSLAPAECIVESPEGIIDARHESLLTAAGEVLAASEEAE